MIERDATTLWYANDELRRVNLTTVEDHCCQQMLDLLDQAGVYAVVWDITSDTGIPTYACTILEQPDQPTGRGLGSYNGFGCHLAPAIALLRALTEAIQSRVTCIAGSRDDLFRDVYRRQEDEDRLHALWDEIANTQATTSLAAHPSLATESFEEDIALILTALHRIGVVSVVVDLTKPEIGIPVAKVMVPGLEGLTELECRPGQRVAKVLKEPAP